MRWPVYRRNIFLLLRWCQASPKPSQHTCIANSMSVCLYGRILKWLAHLWSRPTSSIYRTRNPGSRLYTQPSKVRPQPLSTSDFTSTPDNSSWLQRLHACSTCYNLWLLYHRHLPRTWAGLSVMWFALHGLLYGPSLLPPTSTTEIPAYWIRWLYLTTMPSSLRQPSAILGRHSIQHRRPRHGSSMPNHYQRIWRREDIAFSEMLAALVTLIWASKFRRSPTTFTLCVDSNVYHCLHTEKGLTLRSYELLQQLHVAWLRNKAHRAHVLVLR
jgi:hypothetical protein